MFNVIRPSKYPLTVIRLPLGPVYKMSKLPSILDSINSLRPVKYSASTFAIVDFRLDRFSISAITLVDTVKSRSTVWATIASISNSKIQEITLSNLILIKTFYTQLYHILLSQFFIEIIIKNDSFKKR